MAPPEETLLEVFKKHAPEFISNMETNRLKRSLIGRLIGRSTVQAYYICHGKGNGITYQGAKNLIEHTGGRLTLEMLEPYISK